MVNGEQKEKVYELFEEQNIIYFIKLETFRWGRSYDQNEGRSDFNDTFVWRIG